MDNKYLLTLSLSLLTSVSAFADTEWWGRNELPDIYPFVPTTTEEIYKDVENISEDKNFVKNFNDILRQRLSKGKTKIEPWSASYWPLAKGTIADPYENSKIPYYIDFARTWKFQWKSSWSSYLGRKNSVHANIDRLSSDQLAGLAPSEKYDLLLGDKTFDLTNRLMKYMHDYGSDNNFFTFEKVEELLGKDTLGAAQQILKEYPENYKDLEDVLRNDYVLSKKLESVYALELMEAGRYSNVESAMPEALKIANEEKNNFVIQKNIETGIAAWEGICNGWSTAAGIIPRPSHAVDFKLPDGRNLRFYPDDIKGLISLYWVNSIIQDGVIRDEETGKFVQGSGGTLNVGLRCNLKNADKDRYGRLYDSEVDPLSNKLDSRCAGVHPAKWHLSLVNLIGKQGRSFVVERKITEEVDNHPMKDYSMRYFNPLNGREYSGINDNVTKITKNDQFFEYRNPKAVFIVGVETTMGYMDYKKPYRFDIDAPEYDVVVRKTMYYDLELDQDLNIIGGQWRAKKSGKPRNTNMGRPGSRNGSGTQENHNQPDFFWAITKDWKKTGLFKDEEGLTSWTDKKLAPPKDWLDKAREIHAFEYINNSDFNFGKDCYVRNTRTGKVVKTLCEHKTNKAQPLSNIVNTLIELSQ